MKKTEYFVYCGFFIRHLWGERFVPWPKGEFLEIAYYYSKETGREQVPVR